MPPGRYARVTCSPYEKVLRIRFHEIYREVPGPARTAPRGTPHALRKAEDPSRLGRTKDIYAGRRQLTLNRHTPSLISMKNIEKEVCERVRKSFDGILALGPKERTIESIIAMTFLTVILLSICVLPAIAQGDRYYAGYCLYDTEFTLPAPFGVSVRIYTISKSVPTGQFYAQWPTVVLSYALNYWIQVGYTKGYDTNYRLKWYAEKYDQSGYKMTWWTSSYPSAGATYNY